MQLLHNGPPDPHANLALDAELFARLEARIGGESLRIWEPDREAVVVGRFGAVAREVHERACLDDGVPVVRRSSGGGSVMIGPGCLSYSVVLSLDSRPELRDVAWSYRALLGRMAAALALPGLDVAGASDLALHGRKVSGSAQRRGRRALLHHGTILYAFDVERIERYLREPARQPAYRRARRHVEFLTNAPLAAEAIRAAVLRGFASGADLAVAGA